MKHRVSDPGNDRSEKPDRIKKVRRCYNETPYGGYQRILIKRIGNDPDRELHGKRKKVIRQIYRR